MSRLILRGFAQRRLRALLTGLAIALGVALMAGTYILTDTIDHSFAGIFGTAYRGTSVVVTEKHQLGRKSGSQTSIIDGATLAKVRSVPGVAEASGGIFEAVAFLTPSGVRLTGGQAPSFLSSVHPSRFESFKAVEGSLPSGPGQVAIDQATAHRNKLKLGGEIVIAGRAPSRRYRIVGVAKYESSSSFGGASVAIVTLPEAQAIMDLHGRYDSISVAASGGVTPKQLATRMRKALPASLTVRTGEEEAANQTSEIEKQLGFLRTFLLIFAYVALVVGAFIIFNTFSITVAQRTREFGLLRTLGASRSQIMRSVVAEGLLLGVLGAVAGLFIGIGLAPALDGLFKAFGANLPDSGTVLQARTVIVSLAVGIVVTVLAGLFPAIRATRVPPIAAMREGVSIPPRRIPSRRRLIVRFIVLLVVVLAVSAASGSKVVLPILLIVWAIRGAVLFSRVRRSGQQRRYRIIPALGRALGLIVSWRGVTGRLARENSVRQPGRTLVTALALTVGLGLVVFIAVLADGFKATVKREVARSFAGSLIIQNTQEAQGIPSTLAPAVRKVEGVASVTAIAFSEGRLRKLSASGATSKPLGEKTSISAIEPSSFPSFYKVDWSKGSNADYGTLEARGAIVKEEFAKAHGIHAGQRLSVLTPTGAHVTLKVTGIVRREALLLANLTISRSLARSAFGEREDAVDFVDYGSGAGAGGGASPTRARIDSLLKSGYPQARTRTAAQYSEHVESNINGALILVYVLLALSVVVSLFGIVNTLVLSIYERTPELGMLRAIGTSRRQVRQMIRYESLITGLIGGVLGLVIGVVGAVLVAVLALSGTSYVFSVPVGTLVIALVVSGAAGLLAAQLPARRAARLDVLSALASE
ncbi:MAG: ABC transporter permease [Solirubrobacteraceae bacterium]